jgi:hypothetical protein
LMSQGLFNNSRPFCIKHHGPIMSPQESPGAMFDSQNMLL